MYRRSFILGVTYTEFIEFIKVIFVWIFSKYNLKNPTSRIRILNKFDSIVVDIIKSSSFPCSCCRHYN